MWAHRDDCTQKGESSSKWPLGRHLQTSNQLFESQSSEALSHNVPVIEFSWQRLTLSFLFSLTCFRMTCTRTQLDLSPPWKLRSGLMVRMETPSSSPWRTATSRSRIANSRWSKRTFWTARWPRTQRTRALPTGLPPRLHRLWVFAFTDALRPWLLL